MPLIDANRVTEILKDCLFRDDETDRIFELIKKEENPEEYIVVDGITNKFGFHPERIAQYEDEITEMLMNLPTEFHTMELHGGGGWSFLNACNDRNGEQWTGLHKTMDELFCLGQAIGKVKAHLPRSAWSALPGGVPYYVVSNTKFPTE